MDDQADPVTTLTRPRREEVDQPDAAEPSDDGPGSIEEELRAAIAGKLRRPG